ncbi:sigma-70 family RNA polymerase sigma factor [Streptomyces sp. NPDC003077]|uniref:RNA polymerase sigma factor n=1 Tax=Streptomyces sp. NPDC003077 TaxID=3154443 RepID=UPI0033B1DE14
MTAVEFFSSDGEHVTVTLVGFEHSQIVNGMQTRRVQVEPSALALGDLAPSEGPLTERARPDTPLSSQDRTDFARFFRGNFDAVARFVIRQGANQHEATEATQVAFTVAWQQWPTIEHPAAWLRRVAYWTYLKRAGHLQKDTPVDSVPDHAGDAGEDAPLARALVRDGEQRVRAALLALPVRQRQVMAWHLDGFSHAEVAQELNLSTEAVRAAYARARTSLRKILGLGGGR